MTEEKKPKIDPSLEYAAKLAFQRDIHQILEETHRKLRERKDEEINRIGQKLGMQEAQKSEPQDEAPCNKMPWEKRNGAKGPFEMTSLKNCNNVDLFRHLVATMKQNNRRFTEKTWTHYYWLGKDDDVIFRREKKVETKT